MPAREPRQFLDQERVEDRGAPGRLHFTLDLTGEFVPAHIQHGPRTRLDIELQLDRGSGLFDVAARPDPRLLEPPLPQRALEAVPAVLPA